MRVSEMVTVAVALCTGVIAVPANVERGSRLEQRHLSSPQPSLPNGSYGAALSKDSSELYGSSSSQGDSSSYGASPEKHGSNPSYGAGKFDDKETQHQKTSYGASKHSHGSHDLTVVYGGSKPLIGQGRGYEPATLNGEPSSYGGPRTSPGPVVIGGEVLQGIQPSIPSPVLGRERDSYASQTAPPSPAPNSPQDSDYAAEAPVMDTYA